MSDKAFFSVIIPTLNEEHYLPKILSDLGKQKLKNFEVIVVDGISEDKTKDKALEFSGSFPLKFYSVEKRNVAYQRNYGARKAAGEYFLFLDADARIEPTLTEKLYKNILQKRVPLLLPSLVTEEKSLKDGLMFNMTNSVIQLSQLSGKPLSSGGSIFASRKLFADLDGFKEDLYISEDHNFVQRARKLGVRAKILKEVKVVFNLRRMKKEGQMMIAYKYFLALVWMILNRKVTSKIFTYDMGGGKYKNPNSEQPQV